MRNEFMEKMLEAKRLELEAVSLILPAAVGKHMQIIGQELGAMAREIMTGICSQEQSQKGKRVKKVTID